MGSSQAMVSPEAMGSLQTWNSCKPRHCFSRGALRRPGGIRQGLERLVAAVVPRALLARRAQREERAQRPKREVRRVVHLQGLSARVRRTQSLGAPPGCARTVCHGSCLWIYLCLCVLRAREQRGRERKNNTHPTAKVWMHFQWQRGRFLSARGPAVSLEPECCHVML